MNKKILVCLVCIIVLMTVVFTACSFTKSTKVIVENRDIESINLIVFDSQNTSHKYELTSGEITKLKDMLDNLGYIEREYISNPIISETFDYTLEVNVAKKGLKKAYTYYVKIGRVYSYSINNKDILNQKEPTYLSIETNQLKYAGQANEEIVAYLALMKASII